MLTPNHRLLVRILATEETAWLPHGLHVMDSQRICARRTGLKPLSVGGGNEARRQETSRGRAALAAEGLLWGERLTPAGRRLARSLSWYFEVRTLKTATRRMRAAIKRGDFMQDYVEMIPEGFICGTEWGDQNWWLRRLFLPLLANQVLISRTDVFSLVWYGFALSKEETTEAIDSLIDGELYVGEASDAYDRELWRCRAEMLGDDSRFSETFECPLRADTLESGRWADDLRGIKKLFTEASKEAEADA